MSYFIHMCGRFLFLLGGILLFPTNTCSANILPVRSDQLINDRLDRLRMTDLDGNSLSMADFTGKPVFLNFWATWCKPCIQEMAYIEQLYQIYGEDIIFLAVSRDELETIRQFQQTHDLGFQFVRLDVEYIDAFVTSLPTTLLIDRRGEVIHDEEGVRVWDSENCLKKVRDLIK